MNTDRSTPGSQTSLREANRTRIVDAVKRYGGLTQVELAEATGLSTATVSTIVKELTQAGVVDTRPTSRSGRRAARREDGDTYVRAEPPRFAALK